MRLTDLNPHWCGAGGEFVHHADGSQVPKRHGVGLLFDCPCGCGQRRLVAFSNPLDGGPVVESGPAWERTGETFETLTLKPSIRVIGNCGWHGWIRAGEVVNA